MHLAIVDSPLQALNAIEYLNRSDSRDYKCKFVVFDGVGESDTAFQQIAKVLDLFGYECNLRVRMSGGYRSLLKSIGILRRSSKAVKKLQVEECIIGEYRLMAAWVLTGATKTHKVAVVDDGSATLRIDRTKPVGRFSRLYSKLLAVLVGGSVLPPDGVCFFSVYDIRHKLSANDSYSRNSYPFIKKHLCSLSPAPVEFIVGSPLAEAGVLKEDKTVIESLIAQLLLHRNTPRDRLIYVAHRRESRDKLLFIERLGVKVISLDYPFELYALIEKKATTRISGFYSSVFANLLNIYQEIDILAFRLREESVDAKFRQFVQSVYQTYEDMHDPRITILDLRA